MVNPKNARPDPPALPRCHGTDRMARRFCFNLQTVLRYREIMEDQRRREFLEASHLVDEERLRREEYDRERGEIQDDIVRSFAAQSPFQSIVSSYHIVGQLENAMLASMRRQQQLEAEREKRRQAMINARQETRMMETLKEHRQEEFVREQDKIEQSLLDELSIQARARRNREEKMATETAARENTNPPAP